MPRDQISNLQLRKLTRYYTLTLDTNADGVVNWQDFEAAVENMLPKEETEKNSRLKIVRKRLEQNFQKYFWDLCEVGDANKDGNIDLDEWLDVMNDIIIHLKQNNQFPEWYEGLHKALWRSNEFYDERDVLKEEFVSMLSVWDIQEPAAIAAYEFITEKGKKKMDYNQFSELMKQFFVIDEPNHPTGLGL